MLFKRNHSPWYIVSVPFVRLYNYHSNINFSFQRVMDLCHYLPRSPQWTHSSKVTNKFLSLDFAYLLPPGDAMIFSYHDLSQATNNFAAERLIGKGGLVQFTVES